MNDNDQKLKPKKSLGQHFLHSKKALEQIIKTANITSSDKVLEIGPGTGILTSELLKTGAKIFAVEKDHRAISLLSEKFFREISDNKLKLVNGDILDKKLFRTEMIDLKNDQYVIVANIPYYITGAILEKFLENEPRPKKIVLLVQKEVAERVVAKDEKESILSISVKVFGQPKLVSVVPRGAFSPPPKVDSAILEIKNISIKPLKEKNVEIGRFFDILKSGFAHKRKILIKNLEKSIKPEIIKTIWKKTGLNEKIRAEELSINDWIQIADLEKQ